MLKSMPVRPRLCIVGEPTMLQVVTAHKGKFGYRVTAHGLESAFEPCAHRGECHLYGLRPDRGDPPHSG